MIRGNLVSIGRIKSIYAEKQGGHWFDRGTLRFFASRLPRYGYSIGDRVFFVTSEKTGFGFERDRRYSVRALNWADGDINTVGEFLAYETAAQARAAIREIERAWRQAQKEATP